jgi:hypothetical protein
VIHTVPEEMIQSTNERVVEPIPVVYLAGSGHTGSTLLSMLADAHPSIASVGETAVKPKIRRRGDSVKQRCSCGALIVECPFWKEVFDRIHRQGIQFDARTWPNDYRLENPLLHRLLTRDSSYAFLRRFRRWAEGHLPGYSNRIRRIDRVNVAFVRAVLEAAGATVFFDTSKGTARLARILAIPSFDVKVVTLVRDVRAYAASAKRRGKAVTDAASTWRKDQIAIRELIADLPADRRMVIRYEDLCSDPARTLKSLWKFCNVEAIEPPRRLLSRDHHVLGNNMRRGGEIEIKLDDRWRKELDPSEQASILRIAGALHGEFGYGA